MPEKSALGGIPDDVRTFLRTYVDSVGLLEVLLLLHAEPLREWTADDVNVRLQSSLSSATIRLARLRSLGLATMSPGENARYRFSVDDPALKGIVDKLAEVYRNYRIRVIDLLFSQGDQLRSFSDSFRLKGETERE